MFKDPIVDEIRAARQKHAAKFNFDLKKIAQDLVEKQKNRTGKLFHILIGEKNELSRY